MTRVTAVTVAIPDAAELVGALSAVTGTEPTWHPAVVADTGADGRVCVVAGIEVFEVPTESRLPESITLEVADLDAAVARLRSAGFEVTEHVDLPVVASLIAAGVGIRLRRSAAVPWPVTVTDQVLAAWSALAADTAALADAPWLRQPGGRDWAAVVLVERHRAGIGAAVVEILQRELPALTVAGLCVRDVIRACNEAYTPIAGQVAAAAAAGEHFDLADAVAEAEPFLHQKVSLAVERAVRRG